MLGFMRDSTRIQGFEPRPSGQVQDRPSGAVQELASGTVQELASGTVHAKAPGDIQDIPFPKSEKGPIFSQKYSESRKIVDFERFPVSPKLEILKFRKS